jgi:predicted DNA binding CopG/RHH family protein
MRAKSELKTILDFASDEEAERFVESADLTDFDLSDMKPMHFDFGDDANDVHLRLPASLLDAIKSKAKERGVTSARIIRDALEQALAK